MEPEGSSPHSQVPATCPYPEPARSSPSPHISLPEDPSQYNPPTYAWTFQVVNFSQAIPTKTLYKPPFSASVLHAPSVSFYSIWVSTDY